MSGEGGYRIEREEREDKLIYIYHDYITPLIYITPLYHITRLYHMLYISDPIYTSIYITTYITLLDIQPISLQLYQVLISESYIYRMVYQKLLPRVEG